MLVSSLKLNRNNWAFFLIGISLGDTTLILFLQKLIKILG